MIVDLFLPLSFFKENSLFALETVVFNKQHACTIGISPNDSLELANRSLIRFNLNENIINVIELQRPSFVKPVKLLEVKIIGDNDASNQFVLPMLESSLLFKMQGAHIVLGSCESFELLGCRRLVRYLRVIGADGNFFRETVGLNSTMVTDDDTGQFIKEECFSPVQSVACKENWDRIKLDKRCTFLKSRSVGVFKIGPSTQIRIVPAETGEAESDKCYTALSKLPEERASSETLFGLDFAVTTVTNYLRDFALSSVYSNRQTNVEAEHGILLYGLPGCGKSTLLRNLTKHSSTGQFQEFWQRDLKFITISRSVVSELNKKKTPLNKNPFYVWIKCQLAIDPTSTNAILPIVLLLPDLDSWALSNTIENNDDGVQTEDSSGSKSPQSYMGAGFHQLLDAIALFGTDAIYIGCPVRFCVMATATTMDELFNLIECRQLFHRRLLVSLPDAHTRFRILRYFIISQLQSASIEGANEKLDEFFDFPEVNNCLIQIASKLHGYTPKDLHRLVQVSCSSLLSRLFMRSVKEPENAPCAAHPLILDSSDAIELCKILSSESLSYLQINLSQHIAPVSPLRWDDIGGYEQLKALFQGVVQNRLLHAVNPDSIEAQADAALGLRVPRGILLHGPPGCSKTMFVRALATECQLPLIAVQASRIFGRYVGDSERNMRRVLVQARASAPAILFIDEVDLLLPSRSSSETGASEHVLGEVLTAMDGVEGQSGQVILIAATNRMDKLDSALSRAGRFDLVIPVPPPDASARLAILRLELSRRATDICLEGSADWLQSFATVNLAGYTGAEIVQVVQQAAQSARDSGHNRITCTHLVAAQQQCPPVSLQTFARSTPTDLCRNTELKSKHDVRCNSLSRSFLFLFIIPVLLALLIMYLENVKTFIRFMYRTDEM